MTVEVNNESGESVDEHQLSDLAQYVLNELGVHPRAELSLMLVDVGTMESLHQQFMGEPGPTDVLAFPMDELRSESSEDIEDGLVLGDVVLCPTVAGQQAAEAGHARQDELNLLCAHGILHLLGYDHHEADDEREMFGLQARLLSQWGHREEASAP